MFLSSPTCSVFVITDQVKTDISSNPGRHPIGLLASSLDFGRRHLSFLEPEVAMFGREASNVAIPDDRASTELAANASHIAD